MKRSSSLLLALLLIVPARSSAQSVKLTSTSAPGGATDFRVDASGMRLVVRENGRLTSRRLDRASAPVLLNQGQFAYSGFVLSPDGTRVVFQSGGANEVYSVPFAGGEAPLKLNGTVEPFEGEVYQNTIQVSPDGTRVLYRGDEDANFVNDGYTAPIDGSAPAVQLNGNLMCVYSLAFTPDSQRVVMIASSNCDSTQPDLFVAPADGSTAPVKLNQPLGGPFGNTKVRAFRMTPASDRVVFWADRDTATTTKLRLFSVPLDGSALPVEIGGAPGNVRVSNTAGSLVPFTLSPDGARAVYVGDQSAGNLYELFSVPVDGSSASVRLNATLVTGGDVSVGSNALPFQVGPDGASVAFVADQDVNDLLELYAAPIDGSAGPTKLSGTLVTGGDVRSLVVAPTSAHVAYVADQDTDGVSELYVAPADGSAAPVKVSGPFTASVVVSWYGFAPAGSELLYVADQDVSTRNELYRTPIDASSPARKLSPPVLAGDVLAVPAPLPFRSGAGPRVLFLGDLEVAGVLDLYQGFLSKPVLPVAPPSQAR